MNKPLRSEKVIAELLDWVRLEGTRVVRKRLRDKGVGHSTAEKLTLNKYPHELGPDLSDKIKAAMAARVDSKAS